MLKFSQKEFTTKDFYGQRQITDLLQIDANKVVRSLIRCHAIMEKTVVTLWAINLMRH